MKFFSDFKKFVMRGNVVDMAIGVIIATAFTAIVTALANKIIMPLVNWFLLAVTGQGSMDAIYTYLHKVYTLDELGNPTTTIDLANSIYIDWGAFITAIIDFLLIALILFIILKIAMHSSSLLKSTANKVPTKEERAQLKEAGVNMKNPKAVKVALAELREKNRLEKEEKEKAEKEEAFKKSTEGLLAEIRDLLKESKQTPMEEKPKKDDKK